MRKVMRFLVAGLALTALTTAATPARAGTLYNGYLCYVGLHPGVFSNDSYVFVNVYSGPDCTGNFLGGPVYFCSTGSNSPICNPGFLYSEAKLVALYEAAMRAIDHNIRAQVWTDSNCGLPSQCGSVINFLAQ